MKICYFGIYDPEFSRNKIYISGLRKLGVEIMECRDNSPGPLKFWRLWMKHRKIGNYDAMIVGYPGHMAVPFAKLISNKKVIADLLGSLYDAEVHSHNPSFFKKIKARIADYLAVKFAAIVLLESEAQKKYFEQKFGKSNKYKVIYTGARDSFLSSNASKSEKGNIFRVIFRGRLTPESGISHILKAAEILKDENILFKIVGGGQLLKFAEQEIKEKKLDKVELIPQFVNDQELIALMLDSDLSLGQIEDNPRLNRTIPHKAFESFALGIPYLSGDAPAVREVVIEGKTGFLTPLADPIRLADKIKELSKKSELLAKVSTNSRKMFNAQFTPTMLAQDIFNLISKLD